MVAWSGEDIRSLRIANVSDDERGLVRAVLGEWNARLEKNAKRSLYYDTEQSFKDLGIALPPQLRRVLVTTAGALHVEMEATTSSSAEPLEPTTPLIPEFPEAPELEV